MPRKRSTDTAEFEPQAVKMVTGRGLSVAEVGRRLDVGEDLPRTRREGVGERADAAFPGRGNPTPADDEPPRPRAGNARPGAGRGPLKDAAAYLASPPS
jgi:transposase